MADVFLALLLLTDVPPPGPSRPSTTEGWMGRIWYCIDDEKKTVWLTAVHIGHPKATE